MELLQVCLIVLLCILIIRFAMPLLVGLFLVLISPILLVVGLVVLIVMKIIDAFD